MQVLSFVKNELPGARPPKRLTSDSHAIYLSLLSYSCSMMRIPATHYALLVPPCVRCRGAVKILALYPLRVCLVIPTKFLAFLRTWPCRVCHAVKNYEPITYPTTQRERCWYPRIQRTRRRQEQKVKSSARPREEKENTCRDTSPQPTLARIEVMVTEKDEKEQIRWKIEEEEGILG